MKVKYTSGRYKGEEKTLFVLYQLLCEETCKLEKKHYLFHNKKAQMKVKYTIGGYKEKLLF